MIILDLVRTQRFDYAALGRMSLGPRSWFTIERPWITDAEHPGGVNGISCVLPGSYKLERHTSEAHPNVFALVNPLLYVWHQPWEIPKGAIGRSSILIHPANFASELAGCIAVGKESRPSPQADGRWGVFRSRDAMNELKLILNGSVDMQLNIREEFSS